MTLFTSTSESQLALAGVAAIALAIWAFNRKTDLPPGPHPLPIFGNALQIPTKNTWLYFKSLSEKYGPMVRLRMAGQEIVVLDRIEDVQQLLVQRSGNYSSRPSSVYATKYRSNNKRLVLLPYGLEMKKQRAAIFQMLNAKVVGGYEEIQDRGSMKLLSDILDRPSDAYISVKWFTAELLVTLVYGKKFKADGTELKTLLHILETFVEDVHPARYFVDIFPILDYLPGFLSPWKAEATRKYDLDNTFYTRLLNDVKTAMDNGADLECFAARLWENEAKLGLDRTSLAFVAGSTFEAGTDNTAGSVLWFIEAMMLFPDVLKKAHAELDAVVGDSPPGFHNLEDLPYCSAVVRETFRWMPVAPVGGARRTTTRDVHLGYHIPAGTVIFANVWSIHHNPEHYPDPFAFKPERFMPKEGERLGAEALIEGHYGFGFGRRTCPGQYLASKSVWIAIVRLLWAFDIKAPVDASGNPILPDPGACRQGLTAEPSAYQVDIKPRSAKHANTIKALREGHLATDQETY